MGLIRQSPHLKLKIKSLSGKTEKKNHQELLALQTHTHKAMTYLNHNNLLQNMEIGQALDARVYHLVVQVYVTTITTPL